jgi:hypothetical protein
LRRTGAKVEGRIESRGVGLIYPVGGEPGARAGSPESKPARELSEKVSKGLKRELLAERNEFNITSGLSIFGFSVLSSQFSVL